MSKVLRLLKPPFALSVATCLAAVLGFVSPVLTVPFLKLVGYCLNIGLVCVIGVVTLALASCLIAVIYRLADRRQMRRGRSALEQAIAPSLLFALGLAGSVWCYSEHVCMAGHMQHPPYPGWHHLVDAGWVLFLVGSAVWLALIRSPISIAVAALSSFVVSYRFLFGSFGGIYPVPI